MPNAQEKSVERDGALLIKRDSHLEKEDAMIHTLLGIAAVIFVVWLLLVVVGHVGGVFINLLWILILIALIWWLVSFFTGRSRRTL